VAEEAIMGINPYSFHISRQVFRILVCVLFFNHCVDICLTEKSYQNNRFSLVTFITKSGKENEWPCTGGSNTGINNV
jgi:hypothetical protein